MQRPILILVLVVAAIGALLFGVLHLLGDAPAPNVVDQNEVVAPKPVPKPGGDHELTPDTTSSHAGGRAATEVEKYGGADASFQYDNQLVGEVVNKEHAPVPDVELTLSTVGTQEMMFMNDPVDHSRDITKRTDKDGKFRFTNIEPRARYSLVLVHPDYSRKEILTVPVGPQGIFTEPQIELGKGTQLTGYVKDEAGNVISGATLHLDGLRYQGSPYTAPDRMTVTTSPEGWYVFANVPPGNRSMTVSAPGYGTLTVPSLMFQANQEPTTRDVLLKVAEMICGRVVDREGAPIPGAMLLAVGHNAIQQTTRGTATSDAKGEFCIESLMPGQYNIIATAKGYRFERALRVASNQSNQVITGIREADVCGQVVDLDTGRPIPAFNVRLRLVYAGNPVSQPLPETDTPVSSANGEYCIVGVGQSSDGGYVVEAHAAGYAPGFSDPFTVAPGKNVPNVVIRLGQGASLRGRVVDGTGKPVARALVTTHDNEWTDDAFMEAVGEEYPTMATTTSARTNDKGYFVIKGLTPETYKITIAAAGFTEYAQADIAVNAGQENDVGEVRLQRGGTIKGTLFDPSGRPLAGGRIELAILDGAYPVTYRAKTSQDGSYTITNILPGMYRLTGMAPGDGSANPFEDMMQAKSSEQRIGIANDEVQNSVNVTIQQ